MITFEEELLRTPINNGPARGPALRPLPDRRPLPVDLPNPSRHEVDLSEPLAIVEYNQRLVEFADSKAGNLILLNSLLIAALGALPSDGNLGAFKLVSVLICSAAVYICFKVISTKNEGDGSPFMRRHTKEWEKHDFLFFDRIGKHPSGEEFCHYFEHSNSQDRRQAILQRAYIISGIAKRKFSQYKLAQKVTSIALAVWVTVNMLPFLSL